MKIVVWMLKLLPLVVALLFLHFYLPSKDVVRIVDTDVKRMDVVSRDFVGEGKSGAPARTRDVRFVNAVWPDGKPRVYRNEETDWGFPWYFKFDSGNLQTEAQDLRSTKDNPIWVVITHYGWRFEILSMFPNAVEVERIDDPEFFPIPWFRIVFFVLFGALVALALVPLALVRRGPLEAFPGRAGDRRPLRERFQRLRPSLALVQGQHWRPLRRPAQARRRLRRAPISASA